MVILNMVFVHVSKMYQDPFLFFGHIISIMAVYRQKQLIQVTLEPVCTIYMFILLYRAHTVSDLWPPTFYYFYCFCAPTFCQLVAKVHKSVLKFLPDILATSILLLAVIRERGVSFPLLITYGMSYSLVLAVRNIKLKDSGQTQIERRLLSV